MRDLASVLCVLVLALKPWMVLTSESYEPISDWVPNTVLEAWSRALITSPIC